MIVATKPGYGPAGGQAIEFETTGRLNAERHNPPGWHPKHWSNVLKLASDDVPIHGRILDTEGRPVVGALVQAINLWEGRDGSLDTWEGIALRSEGALSATGKNCDRSTSRTGIACRIQHASPPFGRMRAARSRSTVWAASGSPISR